MLGLTLAAKHQPSFTIFFIFCRMVQSVHEGRHGRGHDGVAAAGKIPQKGEQDDYDRDPSRQWLLRCWSLLLERTPSPKPAQVSIAVRHTMDTCHVAAALAGIPTLLIRYMIKQHARDPRTQRGDSTGKLRYNNVLGAPTIHSQTRVVVSRFVWLDPTVSGVQKPFVIRKGLLHRGSICRTLPVFDPTW